MAKILFKSLFLCLLMSAGAAYARGDFEVISSGSNEFHFRMSIAEDLSDLYESYDEDSARYLSKSTLICIPAGSTARLVSATGSAAVMIPSGLFDDETRRVASMPLVDVSPPITVRNRRLVTVQVFPIEGDRLYTEVEIRLAFEGGSSVAGVSADDPLFDRIFAQTVANFDAARQWPGELPRAAKAAQETPFTEVTTWYKITVGESGLFRVTGAELQSAGLVLGSVVSNDLHLFNGGGRQLEVLNERPRPEFEEVAIQVHDGGDGTFDRDDYVVFFGESVDRWLHEAGEPPRYINNPYTHDNIYWLAISATLGSGLRMSQSDGGITGLEDTTISDYLRHVHSERDTLLGLDNDQRVHDYYRWLWFEDNNPSFFIPAPGAIAGSSAEIMLVAKNLPGPTSADIQINQQTSTRTGGDDTSCVFEAVNLIDGLNRLDITFYPGIIPIYLDYVNASYRCRIQPVGDALDLTLEPVTTTAVIEVTDEFAATPLVLDMADPLRPIVIAGFEQSSGLISFNADLEAGGVNRFYACPVEAARQPEAIERTEVTNLRQNPGQADLIIVTAEAFASALGDYINFRRGTGYTAELVTVEDIYDNFSWGVMDPTAIRDYLKYAYENYGPGPAPSMVLFVGDGNYDFLDHLGRDGPRYVPPYVHPYDASYSYSDDNYVYFGDYGALDSDSSYIYVPDRGLDMIPARWSVRTVSEIQTITAKTMTYESSNNFGLWRTRVSFVADDEFSADRTNETIHTRQADSLQEIYLPRVYERDKIYAIEYPFVNSRKPGVNDAIVDGFNDGRLLVNYVGHGNPGVWAHERIFTTTGDIPRLSNSERLSVVFAASCAIGFYDSPGEQAMAEQFLSHPSGAVGVISATRLVWSSPNARFNKSVFEVLFDDNDLSVCEAVYTAKLLHQYNIGSYSGLVQNDRTFLYMGDPCLRLGRPRLKVAFDEEPDSLAALQPVHLEGRVLDAFGNTLGSDGELHIQVYDADIQKTYVSTENGGTGTDINYSLDGPMIFRGSAGITSGLFSFDFIPPLDISYGGQSARVMVYAVLDTIDAAGLVDSLPIAEVVGAVSDSTGPVIEYAFTGREGFVSGDLISKGDRLEITISDSSGINLAGGLGHGITLEIDGHSEATANLTGLFEYDQNDYTKGGMVYSLDSLELGQHRLKIKAWDNANNSSTAEFAVELVADGSVAVMDLLNYPNPMQDSTTFSFYANQHLEKFSLEIFTLSGKKINSYSLYSLNPGYHDDIIWRAVDADGDRVATGVYIYRAVARSLTDRRETELFGKVVVIN